MMSKTAFITGISGMDGKLLSTFLLGKGYNVIGLVRKQSVHEIENHKNVEYIIGDLTQMDSIIEKLQYKKIDEFYLLGGESEIEPGWVDFNQTFETNVISTLKILEFLKNKTKKSKLFYASSSEVFGNPTSSPQNETTQKNPRNPYGYSKLMGQELISQYRNLYNLFCCSGILYNHESEFRRRNVVTKKIVQGVVNIKLGIKEKIVLGNLNSRRDWSSAKDFVHAMWLILQQDNPDDYILSSNSINTVENLLDVAFNHVGIKDWNNYIEIDKSFFRECETIDLIGDNSKIKSIGWEPKLSFEEMIKEWVNYELNNLQ